MKGREYLPSQPQHISSILLAILRKIWYARYRTNNSVEVLNDCYSCPVRLHAAGSHPLAFWRTQTFSLPLPVGLICLYDGCTAYLSGLALERKRFSVLMPAHITRQPLPFLSPLETLFPNHFVSLAGFICSVGHQAGDCSVHASRFHQRDYAC